MENRKIVGGRYFSIVAGSEFVLWLEGVEEGVWLCFNEGRRVILRRPGLFLSWNFEDPLVET